MNPHPRHLADNVLHLRAVEPSDAPWLAQVENDTDAWHASDSVAPVSMAMLDDYCRTYDADPFRAGQLRLIAQAQASGQRVGVADLYRISARDRLAFVGIYVCPPWRGQGLGARMVRLLSDYALQVLCLHQLVALVDSRHSRSAGIFAQTGYRHTATLHHWRRTPSGYNDVQVWQLINHPEYD